MQRRPTPSVLRRVQVSNFTDKLTKFNSGLRYYTVQPVDSALGEDGKYNGFAGYGIINSETDITEHTTICLPAAMFQATHFDDMLSSMLDEKPSLSVVDTPTEDVLPN